MAFTFSIVNSVALSSDVLVLFLQEAWLESRGFPLVYSQFDLFVLSLLHPCVTYTRKDLGLNPPITTLISDCVLVLTLTINTHPVEFLNGYLSNTVPIFSFLAKIFPLRICMLLENVIATTTPGWARLPLTTRI